MKRFFEREKVRDILFWCQMAFWVASALSLTLGFVVIGGDFPGVPSTSILGPLCMIGAGLSIVLMVVISTGWFLNIAVWYYRRRGIIHHFLWKTVKDWFRSSWSRRELIVCGFRCRIESIRNADPYFVDGKGRKERGMYTAEGRRYELNWI